MMGALTIPSGLLERLEALFPGAELTELEALKPDTGAGDAEKAHGYGRPLRLRLRLPDASA